MPIVIDVSKLSTLTGKAKKLGAALFTMAGLYQVEPVRDKVMPYLIHHPHISSIAGTVFGAWLLFHNPDVQAAGQRIVQLLKPAQVTLPAGTPVEVPDVPTTKQ